MHTLTGKAPAARESSRPDESVAYQLRYTSRMFQNTFNELLKPYDVPVSAWYFLRVLWAQDGLSQKELARRAGLLQSNSSAALKLMLRRGLIRQDTDPTDRRRLAIFLTPKARALEATLMPVALYLREAAMEGFSDQEIDSLSEMLARVRQNVHGKFGAG